MTEVTSRAQPRIRDLEEFEHLFEHLGTVDRTPDNRQPRPIERPVIERPVIERPVIGYAP